MVECVEVDRMKAFVVEPIQLLIEEGDGETGECVVVIELVQLVLFCEFMRDGCRERSNFLPGFVAVNGEKSGDDRDVDTSLEAVVSVFADLIHIEAELCDDEIGTCIDFMSRMFDLFIVCVCADEIREGWFSVLMVAFRVTGDGDAERIGEA